VAEQNVTIEDVEDVAEDIPAIPATTLTVQAKQTRSDRAVKQPACLIEEMGAVVNDYKVELTKAEEHYYAAMKDIGREYAFVGAGLGGGFVNTAELHVMKYNEAMVSSGKEHWERLWRRNIREC